MLNFGKQKQGFTDAEIKTHSYNTDQTVVAYLVHYIKEWEFLEL